MDQHYLSISIKGFRAEVRFNDVTLVETAPEHPEVAYPPVSSLLTEGRNTITVSVTEVAPLPRNADPLSPIRLTVALCRAAAGRNPSMPDIPRLLEIGLAPERFADPPPYRLYAAIDIQSPFGRWAFEDADVLDLRDPRTLHALVGVSRDLHAVVARKDWATFTGLSSICFEESARAHGMSLSAITGRAWEFAEMGPFGAEARIAPFDQGDLVFDLQGHGRLVRLLRANGDTFLRDAAAEPDWELPVFLSRVGGRFQIVR